MLQHEYPPKENEQNFGYIFNLVNSGVPIEKAIDAEEKFRDGRYNHPDFCIEAETHHRIHTSITEPNLFAYFPEPNSEKAVKIRKGKYYQKFFSNMLPEEISELVRHDNDCVGHIDVVTTEDEIIDAYINLGDDFSCMRFDGGWEYNCLPGLEHEVHPVAFYARCKNAHIGIAKIYNADGEYFARALVNIDTKKHSRIYDKYGDGGAEDILLESGYSPANAILKGCLFSAENKKMNERGFIYQLCPYIDGHDDCSMGLLKDKGLVLIDDCEVVQKITNKLGNLKSTSGANVFYFSKECSSCGTTIKEDGPDLCKVCQKDGCHTCHGLYSKIFVDYLGFCPGCALKAGKSEITAGISGKNIDIEIRLTASGRRQFRIVRESQELRAFEGDIDSFDCESLDNTVYIQSQCCPQATFRTFFLQGSDRGLDNDWQHTENFEGMIIEAARHLNSIDFTTFERRAF